MNGAIWREHRYFLLTPTQRNRNKWKLAFILPILRDEFSSNLLFSLYSLLFRERKKDPSLKKSRMRMKGTIF
jgi:hypothetical protein